MEKLNNLSTVYKAIAGAVLVVALYFAYTFYQKRFGGASQPQMPSRPQQQEPVDAGVLTCTLYYTEWCKFCKKAKPEWAQLTDEYNGKVINGKKIVVNSVDCDKNEEVAERENIKGYPTFKFNDNGTYHEYPDEPVYDKLKTFVEYLCSTST